MTRRLFSSRNLLLSGQLYFIALAIISLIASMLNGIFKWFDVMIVLVAALPVLLKSRWFNLLFAGIASLIWSYIGIAVFISHIKGLQGGTPDVWIHYLTGYVLAVCGLTASCMVFFGAYYMGLDKETHPDLAAG